MLIMSGWISLHRSIINHWIFESNVVKSKLEAWLIILLEVNHLEKKILIGDSLVECKRGESLNSLNTWSKLFNWNKSKTRRYFKLLENDSMIELKLNTKTTHLSVLNYDTYQIMRNANETQMKRKRNANETQMTPNNKENNVNKENNKKVFNFKKSLLELGIENQIVDDWLKVRKTKKATNSETSFNGIKNQINKSGHDANYCIKMAAENSWSGFKNEWLNNNNAETKRKDKGFKKVFYSPDGEIIK